MDQPICARHNEKPKCFPSQLADLKFVSVYVPVYAFACDMYLCLLEKSIRAVYVAVGTYAWYNAVQQQYTHK